MTGNAVGAAGSVLSGSNIHVGVMTATSYSGDGSNLTGIAATNFNTQTVTATAAETIIDLSDGNMITMNQSANTTVGFASTSTAMDITMIRTVATDISTGAVTFDGDDSLLSIAVSDTSLNFVAGGSITFESKPSETKFAINLPIKINNKEAKIA